MIRMQDIVFLSDIDITVISWIGILVRIVPAASTSPIGQFLTCTSAKVANLLTRASDR